MLKNPGGTFQQTALPTQRGDDDKDDNERELRNNPIISLQFEGNLPIFQTTGLATCHLLSMEELALLDCTGLS